MIPPVKPEVVVPAVIAAAGGLAFLSYRHREFFLLVRNGISILSVVILLMVTTWNAGALEAWKALIKIVPIDRIDESSRALDAVQLPAFYILGAFLASQAFLSFLAVMPKDPRRTKDD